MKTNPSTAIKTCVALGAASFAVGNAQAAAITYQAFVGLTSTDHHYIGFGYNHTTFSFTFPGSGQVDAGDIFGRTGYEPGKGYVNTTAIEAYSALSINAMISSAAIAGGGTIGSSTSWSTFSALSQDIDVYYGIRFDLGDGNYNYGWVEVSTPGDNFTFVAAGVQQSFNTSIQAGQMSAVPEPTEWAGASAALLGLLYVAKRRFAAVAR